MELEQKIKAQKALDKANHIRKKMLMNFFLILAGLSVSCMLFISTVYAADSLGVTPDNSNITIAFITPTLLAIIFGLLAFIFKVFDWKGFKSYAGKMIQADKITSEMWSKWELEAFHYQEKKYTDNEIKKMKAEALRAKEVEEQKNKLEKELAYVK